ncbi:MAG: pyruvate, phosphate dikinase [Nitrososphaerales archaeon]|nr:pyruvate, phosphate dikinase [Nitrososphaerales archaeon]
MSFVFLFEEAKGMDKSLLGGKGYGLVQMASIGLPVPPGMVITTEACKQYYKTGRPPEGVFDEVKAKLSQIEKKTTKTLGGNDNPLLVSVRSGAPFSMPGMMDTILNLGLNDSVAQRLAQLTGSERFAMDAYRRLIQMYGKVVLGIPGGEFETLLDRRKSGLGVARDAELTASELRLLVQEFKEVLRKKGSEFPQDPWRQLEAAVVAVFRSWDNPRARDYRRFYRIADDLGTAVNIQAMVFGNLGEDSGSGVGFTRDPSVGVKRLYGEYLSGAQGEDVVAGIRTPVSVESLEPKLKAQLEQVATTLEDHFRDMQDYEFTIERGKLYMLQTRNGKRTAQAAVKIAVDMVREGLITKEDAVARFEPADAERLLHRTIDPRASVKPIAKGLNASPGAISGKVVLDTGEAADLGARGVSVILVRPETTPEDIRGVIGAQGILTARGGMTSHAAVVARGMGKPAVVGCSSIRLHPAEGYFETEKGDRVRKGDVITLDGTTGTVMLGEVPTIEPQLTEEFRTLLGWADKMRRLGVYANADDPAAAARARDFGAEGIGLCRTERMFNAPDRLRLMHDMILAETPEAKSAALRKLIPFQLNDFKGIFKEMVGKPVIVRLLDLPLHEFLPEESKLANEIASLKAGRSSGPELQTKEIMLAKVRQLSEHNPMLGHRGCRLAVTFPEMYEVQVEAIVRAALEVRREVGKTAEVFIMLPLISEVEEMVFLRKVVDKAAERTMKEMGERIEYKVGTMIETPRAALTAGKIALHADFFSFGTNDLTQATFAFSRDDVEAKFMAKYLEERILPESPFEVLDATGVGRLIEIAVSDGRKAHPGLEVGICGEHGGEPRSIDFFNRAGLDYVSCSGFRIPVARLAAAQATLAKKKSSSTV